VVKRLRLHLLNDTSAFNYLTENNVLVVQMGGFHEGDEKLRTVGVGTSVGHRQKILLVVFLGKVLIGKLLTVDRLATSSVSASEVTTLGHEASNDTVELGALVTKALLTSAKGTEVLGSLRSHIIVELEDDAAPVLTLAGGAGVGNVEESLNHGGICGGKVSCSEGRFKGCGGFGNEIAAEGLA